MQPIITILIKADPVAKQRARGTRHGHHYTPAKTRKYEQIVATLAQSTMSNHGLDMLTCDLIISVHFERETGHQVDLDNLIKALKDGCNKVLWNDDKQVVGYGVITLKRKAGKGRGFTLMNVYEATPTNMQNISSDLIAVIS